METRRTSGDAAVLAVASLGAFLAFLDATIVNVAFPDMRRSFADTSLAGLSWVLNAYNIVFAAFLVAAGRLTDLLGRRRVFTSGVALFTLASVLCALAPSAEVLIAMRVLQAIGAAAIVPASLAIVIEAFPPERRAHAVGAWGAVGALAAGLGPPLGGALVELGDWRLAFLVNLPLGTLTAVLAGRTLVESRAPGRRTLPDLRGAAAFGAGIGALTLAIVQGEKWGWLSVPVLSAFAAAVVLVAVFARRSSWHPSPVLDPALARVRSFAAANVLTIVAGAGFYAYLLCHILFLTVVWDYGVLRAGLAVAPGAVAATLSAGLVGRLADRHDPRAVIGPGALLWAASFIWYVTQVGAQPAFLAEWLPGQILSGIGVGATLPPLAAVAVAAVPDGRYATAAAVVSSARQLGGVLGIALLVVIVGTPASAAAAAAAFEDGWLFSAVCFAVVAAGAVAIGRTPGQERAEPMIAPATIPAPLTVAALATPPVTHDQGIAAGDLLGELPPATQARLADGARNLALAAGETLFEQGDPADAMYVVTTGRLKVVKDGAVVDVLGRGSVVGELALLTGATRSASVRAGRDSELLCLGRKRFQRAITADPAVMADLTKALASRLAATPAVHRDRKGTPAVIAFVGLHPRVPTKVLAQAVAHELGRHGSVALPGACDAKELEAAERGHDWVLLIAGDEPVQRAFAVRQADRVFALTLAAPVPSDLHADCAVLRGCDLVFCGPVPDRALLSGWHDALDPRQGHHVAGGAHGLEDGAARIARRLAGRSVGVVLSGGGARGLAHLGVLRELEAAGIDVERIGGCSMGGYIAALHASGLRSDQIDARCYEEFVRRNPVNDYRLPSISLVRGRKGRVMLERTFGDALIEELPRELFIVSADLNARELVVHRRGPIAVAAGASMALPGILPPQIVDGRALVDGGVLDNLPVGDLVHRGEGPVIAVDVSGHHTPGARVQEPPPIRETIARALTMASADTAAGAHELAALVIEPDVDGVGVLEFHQIDRMIEAGRVATREALAAMALSSTRST